MEETGINIDGSRILGVFNAVQSEPRSDLRILLSVVPLQNEPSVKLNFKELECSPGFPRRNLQLAKAQLCKLASVESPLTYLKTLLFGE